MYVARLYNQEALYMMVVYNKDCMLFCNRSNVCIRMLVVVHVVMKVRSNVGFCFKESIEKFHYHVGSLVDP